MSNRTFYASTYVVADGVTRTWPFSFAGVNTGQESGTTPYLYPEDVKVQEIYTDTAGNKQTVQRTGVLNAPNQLTIDGPAVIAGREIRIYRETELRFPLVDYRDLQSVSEHDLDLANRQAVFIAQETRDTASANLVYDKQGHFNAGGRRIVNMAPGVDARDAVNMQQLKQTVRAPANEVLQELPSVEARKGKILTFDINTGQPIVKFASDDTALALAFALADPAQGVGLLGYRRTRIAESLSTAHSMLNSQYVNVWEEEHLSKVVDRPTPDPATWDWTPGVQSAIYAATTLRTSVMMPGHDYRITKTLIIPTNLPVRIIGAMDYFSADTVTATRSAPMRLICDIPSGPVFASADGVRIRLSLRGVAAINISAANPFCRVVGTALFGSTITRCFFHSFGGMVKGNIGFISRITENVCMSTRETCFEASTVDSHIRDNYLSMSIENVGVETAIYRGPIGLGDFTGNFCEFAVKGIVSRGLTNAKITDNTFDYIANALDIAGTSGTLVHTNTFTHCAKEYAGRLALAADDPLRTEPWVCISVGNTARGLSLIGNMGSRVDILGRFRSGAYRSIHTSGNLVEEGTGTGLGMLWDVSTVDIDNLRLTEYDNYTYPAMPAMGGVAESQSFRVGNLVYSKLGGAMRLHTCTSHRPLATYTTPVKLDLSSMPLRVPLRLHVVVGSGFSTYSKKTYDIYNEGSLRAYQASAYEDNAAAASSTVTIEGTSIVITPVGSSATFTLAYHFLTL